jgi:hypothetical protein
VLHSVQVTVAVGSDYSAILRGAENMNPFAWFKETAEFPDLAASDSIDYRLPGVGCAAVAYNLVDLPFTDRTPGHSLAGMGGNWQTCFFMVGRILFARCHWRSSPLFSFILSGSVFFTRLATFPSSENHAVGASEQAGRTHNQDGLHAIPAQQIHLDIVLAVDNDRLQRGQHDAEMVFSQVTLENAELGMPAVPFHGFE